MPVSLEKLLKKSRLHKNYVTESISKQIHSPPFTESGNVSKKVSAGLRRHEGLVVRR